MQKAPCYTHFFISVPASEAKSIYLLKESMAPSTKMAPFPVHVWGVFTLCLHIFHFLQFVWSLLDPLNYAQCNNTKTAHVNISVDLFALRLRLNSHNTITAHVNISVHLFTLRLCLNSHNTITAHVNISVYLFTLRLYLHNTKTAHVNNSVHLCILRLRLNSHNTKTTHVINSVHLFTLRLR
jgi:hypothetical protein